MKNIRKLFESEMEKAEIALAVRDISDRLQKVASDLSRTSVDDVPSIVERIKASHGVDKGNDFGKTVTDKINELIQHVLEAKSAIDDQTLVLSGDASATELDLKPDMEDDMGFDDEDMADDAMDDIPEFPKDDAPLGRKVKPIKNESVLRLLEKCGPSKKKVVTEMYNRGGEHRQKVIDLARKIK
jgi:hypothetical protein